MAESSHGLVSWLSALMAPRAAQAEVLPQDTEARALLDLIRAQRGQDIGANWRARTLAAAEALPERVRIHVGAVDPMDENQSRVLGWYRPGEGKIHLNPYPFAHAKEAGWTTRPGLLWPRTTQELVETLGHELGHFVHIRNRPTEPPLLPGFDAELLADYLGGIRTVPEGTAPYRGGYPRKGLPDPQVVRRVVQQFWQGQSPSHWGGPSWRGPERHDELHGWSVLPPPLLLPLLPVLRGRD